MRHTGARGQRGSAVVYATAARALATGTCTAHRKARLAAKSPSCRAGTVSPRAVAQSQDPSPPTLRGSRKRLRNQTPTVRATRGLAPTWQTGSGGRTMADAPAGKDALCVWCGRKPRVQAALARHPCEPASRLARRSQNVLHSGRREAAIPCPFAWVGEWLRLQGAAFELVRAKGEACRTPGVVVHLSVGANRATGAPAALHVSAWQLCARWAFACERASVARIGQRAHAPHACAPAVVGQALFADSVPAGRRSGLITSKEMVYTVGSGCGPLLSGLGLWYMGDKWCPYHMKALSLFGVRVAGARVD